MNAISLWEPWASLMYTGAKKNETRSWATKFRGDLLICAAKAGLPKKELKIYLDDKVFQAGLGLIHGRPMQPVINEFDFTVKAHELHHGKALCIVTVTDCVPVETLWNGKINNAEWHYGNYQEGRFAWLTDNLRRIKNPFPVKGKQGFFHVDSDLIVNAGIEGYRLAVNEYEAEEAELHIDGYYFVKEETDGKHED